MQCSTNSRSTSVCNKRLPLAIGHDRVSDNEDSEKMLYIIAI